MAWSMLEAIDQHRRPLTAKQLAEILNVSAKTVYAMAHRNDIPSIIMGGSVRFDPKSISYWLRKKDPVLAAAAGKSFTA